MRKLYIVSLVGIIVLIAGLTYADQMTFSTYYPAPFGVYNQMVVRTLGVGDSNDDGSINYLDAPDPNDSAQENDLWVAGSVGIGTTAPLDGKLVITRTPADNVNLVVEDTFFSGIGLRDLTSAEEDFALIVDHDKLRIASSTTDTFTALTNHLTVQSNGNVGIGTTEPTTEENPYGSTTGNLDVNDVWLRDADGGTGAWASAGGGGFDPDPYTGQQSITFPNGMIMKTGQVSNNTGSGSLSFFKAFPTAVVSLQLTVVRNVEATSAPSYDTLTVNGFNWHKGTASNVTGFSWTAIGY